MNTIEELKEVLNSRRPIDPITAKSLQDDFMLRYNQASNAIEGNQLTLIETKVLLENGVTAKGKPFKDHLDIINHQEAIYYLLDLVKNNVPLSENQIKQFNALLLKSTQHEIYAGKYRTLPVTIQGAEHIPPQPYLLPSKMEQLLEQNQRDKIARKNDLERIAKLHADFVAIHPFTDGNGRTGRLIMNLELIHAGYSIAIIEPSDRVVYYNALAHADKGDYQAITALVKETVQRSLERELQIVYPEWKKDYPLLAYQVEKGKGSSEKKFEHPLEKGY
ncbi:Fic family protein [Aggregatibacter actinomycetemcomitans]|uniref:Fic family protein n=1 Tax=Aggregatibacter actinomycetemcomitans TaxID=714 RepID=UPI00197B1E30|nr:Fic family protein [Aggregatibacter actinomycetemcomitans]MBN6059373.1 Fic family protein [Aggregatibacter actinomycetemcomitans]MBN6087874.1 Fic family protein [Aggregatibacter actinomycetemcomitans]